MGQLSSEIMALSKFMHDVQWSISPMHEKKHGLRQTDKIAKGRGGRVNFNMLWGMVDGQISGRTQGIAMYCDLGNMVGNKWDDI